METESVYPKLTITVNRFPLALRTTKSEGCRYANDADSLVSTGVNFVTSNQARRAARPVVNTSWSTGHPACLLEVREAGNVGGRADARLNCGERLESDEVGAR